MGQRPPGRRRELGLVARVQVIGAARVVAGVHYPSDIPGGDLIALLPAEDGREEGDRLPEALLATGDGRPGGSAD